MAGGIYVPAMHLGSKAPTAAARAARTPATPSRAAEAATVPASRRRSRSRPHAAPGRRADAPAAGQANKEIARRLGLSVETVKDHVQAVLRALGVSSRTQAVLAVSQMPSQGAVAPWLSRPMH